MTIKIVLPEGDGVKAGWGTKVYTNEGHEIDGITRITINIGPDEIISATMDVAVSQIENLEGIKGIVVADQIDPKEKLVTINKVEFTDECKEALREDFRRNQTIPSGGDE